MLIFGVIILSLAFLYMTGSNDTSLQYFLVNANCVSAIAATAIVAAENASDARIEAASAVVSPILQEGFQSKYYWFYR
jgi:hypothetical protein